MRSPLFVGASLCALAFSSVAPAHSDSSENQILVTGQRPAAAPADAERRPGGADLVPAAEFEDKVTVSLKDALAFSPGIYAQPRFGQEVRLSVRGSGIGRGFHLRGLTLLQDGIPINFADDNGDFQELDPTVLEHVEVHRGANALRFGGSTLGGAINGVTPTGRSAPGLRLRLDGGSFDSWRGLAAYGFNRANGDAWLALTADRSDGDRDHARRRSLRFHSNTGLDLGGGVETRFLASAQTIRQELPGALDLATALDDPGRGNRVGDQKRDIDSLRLQNRTRIALGSGALELGLFLNAKALHHPIFQVVDQDSTDWGLLARLELARGPIELVLGSTARFGSIEAERFVNRDGERGPRTFAARQRAQTIDLYGEGRYRLGDLQLVAGGIFTHGERSQDQTLPASVSGAFSDSQFSPRSGLLWEPREALALYANYSRSHELPGMMELAQVVAFVPLRSQRAWTAELGARGRLGPARFDVSFYRAKLRGELLQFTVGPDIPASTFNAGRTLHQGVEAGLDLDVAPWARLRQVYQLNDFRFLDDPQYGDNRLPVVPKHLYRAELRLGTDAAHVAPAVEWVPRGAWADYANSLRVGGYATLGFTAALELRRGVDLFLDARNLTGRRAIGDISAVIAATPQSVIFHPIERRAFYAGLRARF